MRFFFCSFSKIVNAIIKAKMFLNSVFCIKGISPDILESIAISAKQNAENIIKQTPFFKLSFSILSESIISNFVVFNKKYFAKNTVNFVIPTEVEKSLYSKVPICVRDCRVTSFLAMTLLFKLCYQVSTGGAC